MLPLLTYFALFNGISATIIDNWDDISNTVPEAELKGYDDAVTSFHKLTEGHNYSFPIENDVLYLWSEDYVPAGNTKFVSRINKQSFLVAIYNALKNKSGEYVFDLAAVAKELVYKKKIPADVLEVIAKMSGIKFETKIGKVREKTLSFKKEGVVYDIKTKPVRKDAIQAGIKLYTFLGHHLLGQVEETGGTVEYLTQDERSWGLNDIRYEELDVFQGRLRDLKHMMRFVEHSIEKLNKELQS